MSKRSTFLTIVAVTSGNFLEMFDFFLFGFFARPIGAAFFPKHDATASILAALATFGAGFLMRPLGALFLGAYLDRVGRRRGLVVTLSIMAVGTLVIALTPSYAQMAAIAPRLAFCAPAAVVLGRLAQGFSAGVELGGVSVYLTEMAPPDRRGFFASWQSGSQQVAVVAAATLGFGLDHVLSQAQTAAFGWRIPFAIGCLLIPLLFILRRRLAETAAFSARTKRPSTTAALRTVGANVRTIATGVLLVVLTTVCFYLITVYTPTFGSTTLKLKPSGTLLVTIAVGVSNFLWLPAFGALSDRIGRKPILVAAASLALVTAYPSLSWLVANPSLHAMLAVELWLSLLYSAYNGAMIVTLVEIVPAEVRTAAFALAYSLATAIFGGFTPFLSQALIRLLADKAAPGFWLTGAAALSLAAAATLHIPSFPAGPSPSESA